MQAILGHNEDRTEWEYQPGLEAPTVPAAETGDLSERIAAQREKILRHVEETRGPNDWDVREWVKVYDDMNAALAGMRKALKKMPETP